MNWKCRCKRLFYGMLHKLFGFHKWHVIPVEMRPYGVEIIKWCNRILEKDNGAHTGKVIEIGCGLGDILAGINVDKRNKEGYDIDKNVIKAAKIAHPGIRFLHGGFPPNIQGGRISIFITVNFLYELDCGMVGNAYKEIIRSNDVKYIVTEKMYPTTPNYPHSHDFDAILGDDYKCINKRSFAANENSRRYILIYKKRNDWKYGGTI